jgi:hypothetical protein
MDKEMFRFRQLFRPVLRSTPSWSSEGCCDDAEEALAATLATYQPSFVASSNNTTSRFSQNEYTSLLVTSWSSTKPNAYTWINSNM